MLFAVGETTWAISTSAVEQTFYLDNITPIPLMPSAVVGLSNLYGEVIPIFNLAVLEQNISLGEKSSNKRCIVIEQGEIKLALLSDNIFSIIGLERKLLQKESGNLCSFSLTYNEEYIKLLDVDKLLLKIRTTIREYLRRDSNSSNW